MRKVFTSPRWYAGHLAVVLLCVAFGLLGRWQWNESQAPGGDFQNFAYAIQWWLFIAVALAWYGKIIKDDVRQRSAAAAGSPRPRPGVAASGPPAGMSAAGTAGEMPLGEAVPTVGAGSPHRVPGLGRQVLAARASLPRVAPTRLVGEPTEAEERELANWNAWLARLNDGPAQ